MPSSPKDLLKTAKMIKEKVDRPTDWPANPYDAEVAKLETKTAEEKKSLVGSFIESIKTGASGKENKTLSMIVNKQIVDLRDKQILKYLKSKGVEL